ncbi:MAG: hypothetical protein IJ113_00175, partial [Eggerthellaceae bacterium]|nr:hypothetical protein [Eggerthellaceae bacterium]
YALTVFRNVSVGFSLYSRISVSSRAMRAPFVAIILQRKNYRCINITTKKLSLQYFCSKNAEFIQGLKSESFKSVL